MKAGIESTVSTSHPASFSVGPGLERPPSVPSTERYRDAELVGAGSMGVINSVYDTVLGRTVAMKILRSDAPADYEARFTREATITAGLEHPGIVTVFDRGTLSHGGVYYTMPLIRGSRLDPQREGTRAALDQLAAVCEAVGHAHGHGIVHRDLKPSNIMVGAFGEVVVLDWGLARGFSEEPDETTVSLREEPEGTAAGAMVGTPLYMSPEQARGELAVASSDVWSIGLLLYEIVAGKHPLRGMTPREVIRRMREADVPMHDVTRRGLSPELMSVLSRALHPEAHERYESAMAMGKDLRRFLAGDRVDAYEYRPLDLLQRFWKAYRFRVSVLGVAAVATLAVAGWAYARTVREAQRAREAELEARQVALEATELRLDTQDQAAELLARQAETALRAGELASATTLAREALSLSESSKARGILAATRGAPLPNIVATLASPCRRPVLSTRGDRSLCLGDETLVVSKTTDGTELTQIPFGDSLQSALLDDSTGHVWTVDKARRLQVFDRLGLPKTSETVEAFDLYPHGASVRVGKKAGVHWRLRDGATIPAFAIPSSNEVVVRGRFNNGEVAITRDDGIFLDGLALEERPVGVGAAVDITPVGGDRLFVPRDDGLVSTFHAASSTWTTDETHLGRITHLTPLGGSLVGLHTQEHGIAVWDVDAQREVVRTPQSWGPRLARREDGTFVSAGPQTRIWELPPNGIPVARFVGSGISAVALRGRDVAIAVGDGSVMQWSPKPAKAWRSQWLKDVVIKSVAYVPDADYIVARSAADPDVAVFEVKTGERRHVLRAGGDHVGGGRRLLALADGSIWSATYSQDWLRWSGPLDESDARAIRFGLTEDASASEGGTCAAFLEEYVDQVSLVESGRTPVFRHLGAFAGARAVDVSDDCGRLAVGDADGVAIVDSQLRTIQRWQTGDEVVDVSIRGSGDLVAAGLRNGTLLVWRVGKTYPEIWTKRHHGKVSTVEFDQEQLVTAGWDGAVFRWGLAALAEPT